MRTNRTRYVLLGALTEGPKTGYEIRKDIEAGISHFWQESYGQIYPQLKALAAEGLAEVETSPETGRQRKVYRITEAGRRELAAWLAEPVQQEPQRNELLLKLIYGRSTTPAVLQGHVQSFRQSAAALKGALGALQSIIAGEPADHPDMAYWLMTLRLGEYIAEARLRWAEETLSQLETLAATNDSGGGADD
ncbi:MAG TPA: PadR family transcriptional regulator [Longimicrobiales bacterium]|nr:PadR family transcriptional regulator [Longimicrobiales bacterium]